MMASNIEVSAFENLDFIEKFEFLREAADGVNHCVDEPTLLSLILPIEGKRVLDVGCGLGQLTATMAASRPRRITAIDRSPQMIAKARDRYRGLGIDFRVATPDALVGDMTFDVVVSSMVMHYVPDLQTFLQDIAHLLSDGGLFVFSQRHPFRTANPFLVPMEGKRLWCLTQYFDEGVREYSWLGHALQLHHRTLETIFGALSRSGFTVQSIKEPRATPVTNNCRAMIEAAEFPAILTCRCEKFMRPATQ
jgi:2-polyprenyl-3-methyl-5-hydroxy-6-metoxy-1,4-benzoquinol methylase